MASHHLLLALWSLFMKEEEDLEYECECEYTIDI